MARKIKKGKIRKKDKKTFKKAVKKTAKKEKIIKEKREEDIKRSSGSIEFCDKCGSILVPIKKGKSAYLKCRGCGSEKRKDVKVMKIVEPTKKSKGVTILEKDITPLPMVEMKCEMCNNNEAYFWLQQTRSADEPPTQFFRCTKCKHTWREYK